LTEWAGGAAAAILATVTRLHVVAHEPAFYYLLSDLTGELVDEAYEAATRYRNSDIEPTCCRQYES
jgi:hypothetical protein